MDQHLIDVALGKTPADMAVVNGLLVNVYSGEILPGGVAIAGERIAAVGDVAYAIGENTLVIDAAGQYITPGFLDGHIHPESANLSMARFAEIALSHGTTCIFSDLHEVGVVGGMEAMHACLDEIRQTPLKLQWMVPSHIPFSIGLETSGGTINSALIRQAMGEKEAAGLSEVVSLLVGFGVPDLLESIDATNQAGKIVCGHGPETHGPLWNAFVAIGVSNDHESLAADEIVQRVRTGVHAQLRHNMIVPTLPELIKAITEQKISTRLTSLCTDDTTAVMLVNEGHMDYLVRLAVGLGIDFISAIQMVTLNTAQAFHVEQQMGGLAPGRFADLNITSGPEGFRVLKTVASGRLVAQENRLVEPIQVPEHRPVLLNTFHLKAPVQGSELLIPAPAGAVSARMHIMRTLPWVPITEGGEAVLPVKDGYIACDVEQDLVHIAVIERHRQTGNIGRAFLGGMGLKSGAMASSIAHDSHNIVVMGVGAEDMALAANRVAELQGGIVLVDGGQVVAEIPLPVVGLLSDEDAWTLAAQRQALLDQARARGCMVSDAFMFLSFITLVAIPAFSITDMGYVDVMQQKLMDPVLGFVS
jgi:adenine deaminase